jgi:hypothetical protein
MNLGQMDIGLLVSRREICSDAVFSQHAKLEYVPDT